MSMETTETKLVLDHHILHRNPAEEKRIAKQIDEQQRNVQLAVNAFNELGLKPLQQNELVYFLQGGSVWVENRWKEEQHIPEGWPKGVNREKFIEILDRPDFTAVVDAVAKVNLLHPDLYYLEADQLFTNQEVREKLIHSETIFLNADEQLRHVKLETLFEMLDEFGLLQDAGGFARGAIAPVNLNATGYSFSAHPTENGRFNVDPRQLKKFLSRK